MAQVPALDNTYGSLLGFFISTIPYFPRFGATLIGVILAAVSVGPLS